MVPKLILLIIAVTGIVDRGAYGRFLVARYLYDQAAGSYILRAAQPKEMRRDSAAQYWLFTRFTPQ